MKRFVKIDNFAVDLAIVDGVVYEAECGLKLAIIFKSGHVLTINYKDSDELYRDYDLLLEELNAVDIVLDEDETEDTEEEDE